MGLHRLNTCIFTGLETIPKLDDLDAIEYYITINEKRHFIRLPYYAKNWPVDDDFFKKSKDVFWALLYNDDWFEDESIFIRIDGLKNLIKSKSIPTTPDEKIEKLFLKLLTYQKEDGQVITFETELYDEILWKILFFKSVKELNYYVKALESSGLIEANFSQTMSRSDLLDAYRITFNGLNYYLKLTKEGANSNKCFVAMSFRAETMAIREAIKDALNETGFEAVIIDEQNIDSDKTINDEIIANLKRCRFCISDFSFHSNGVYFESGFALGQGKKVIYTCRQDEFKNSHFDIRPLQHIIYENPDQLKKDLKNKIDAWIK